MGLKRTIRIIVTIHRFPRIKPHTAIRHFGASHMQIFRRQTLIADWLLAFLQIPRCLLQSRNSRTGLPGTLTLITISRRFATAAAPRKFCQTSDAFRLHILPLLSHTSPYT